MEEIAAVYARALLDVGIEHDRLDALPRAARPARRRDRDANRDLQVFFFSPYFDA